MPACPRDCPTRVWDCHTWCEKYKAYRAACDEEIRKRDKKREVERAVCDAKVRLKGKRVI